MLKQRIKRAAALTIAATMILSMTEHCVYADNDTCSYVTQELSDEYSGYTKISTPADLMKLNSNPTGKFVLTSDIDLSSATSSGGSWDSGNGWNFISKFDGVLDGNGHRIIGMHINGNVGDGKFGLIGTLNGTVRNLGMTKVVINVSSVFEGEDLGEQLRVGAIAGMAGKDSVISGCFVDGTVTVRSEFEYTMVGGLAGESEGEINNCFNNANLLMTADLEEYSVAGICGKAVNIKECYNTGKVECKEENSSTSDHSSAITGAAYKKKIAENCYYLNSSATLGYGLVNDWEELDEYRGYCEVKALAAGQMMIKDCFTGFDFDNVWEMDANGSYKYPQIRKARVDRISDIQFGTVPTKKEYYQGDALNIDGGTLRVTYQDTLASAYEVFITEDMVDKTSYDMTKIGKQNVRITFGGCEVTYTIEVLERPIESIRFNNFSITIAKGEQKAVPAIVKPQSAAGMITYSSSAPGVVSVDENTGTISGISEGKATITASSPGGLSASYEVRVLVRATDMRLNKTELNMQKDEIFTLKATTSPVDSGDTVTWSSSNDRVVTVSSSGRVIARGIGKATVSATVNDITRTCSVTVTRDIGEFECSKIKKQYYTGKRIEPEFEVTDGDTVLTPDVDYSVSYSGNIKAGTATIVIKGKGYYTGSIATTFKIISRTYSVKFMSCGKIVNVQSVRHGNNAVLPKVTRRGYLFDSWSESVKNVHSSMVVVANWKKIKLTKPSDVMVANMKSAKIKAVFGKCKNAEGYEIRYSNKKGMSDAKTVTTKKNTVTLRNVEKNTVYSVQVRAYKKDSTGNNVYSKWSKQQKVYIIE